MQRHASHNKQCPGLFDMHTIASERSLSPETPQLVDNFCFTRCVSLNLVICLFFFLVALDFVCVHVELAGGKKARQQISGDGPVPEQLAEEISTLQIKILFCSPVSQHSFRKTVGI